MNTSIVEYDVKQLVKDLEVKVGRTMTAYAASTAISVILKWLEKSIIKSPSKTDDIALALYPALIKFISTKIDMKEFKGDFEVEKEFDLKVLVEQLKNYGLVVAEETAVEVIEVCLKWLSDSARASENPYDNVIEVVIPVIVRPLSDFVNGISDDVDTEVDLSTQEEISEMADDVAEVLEKADALEQKSDFVD